MYISVDNATLQPIPPTPPHQYGHKLKGLNQYRIKIGTYNVY